MRILIVSDTHKHNENLEKVIDKIGPIDMIIHCGDAEGTEDCIRYSVDCPMYIVAGNNDYFSELDGEMMFDVDRYKVFLTHGHYYYVNMGTERLVEEAKSRGADIVIYGHTHKPKMEVYDGVVVLNPGSISYPRQNGRIPTYMIMDIDEKGDVCYTLHHVPNVNKS